jgi:[ribosomal protein S18]-alanine N-acetyltransferase
MAKAELLTPDFHLRPMREMDLDGILMAEAAAYDFPWEAEAFRECLRVGYNCWVAESERALVGHGVMSVGADECHVLNLCVHPQWQGRGIGRRLLQRLLGLARARGADTAFLEVRVSNDSARALYAAAGFCEIGTRRGYYPARHGREDAVVLALALRGFEDLRV